MILKRFFATSRIGRSNATNHNWKTSWQTWSKELLNYDDSARYWQDKLLSQVLPYYHSNPLVGHQYGQPEAYCVQNHLQGPKPVAIVDKETDQWVLNEIRVVKESNKESEKRHVVMLHGFAASSVWWARNMDYLVENSKADNLHIHSLDMLGFGLSGRPDVIYPSETKIYKQLPIEIVGVDSRGKIPFCVKCHGRVDGRKDPKTWCECGEPHYKIKTNELLHHLPNQESLVKEVEDIYVESLEQWRILNNIDSFDLVSHSLGAYMSLAYSLKYPNRVNKLVLTSPGGMEKTPFAVTNPEYKELVQKVEKGEAELPTHLNWPISSKADSYQFLGRVFSTNEIFRKCWDANVSLFGILRWLGPVGPKLIYDFFEPKLLRTNAIKSKEEMDLFIKYMYSSYIRESFSETSINRIFESTFAGKVPILDKVSKLQDENQLKDTLWLFGQYDIMYPKTGELASKILQDQGKSSGFKVISNAGHNVAMDNDLDFNETVMKYLDL